MENQTETVGFIRHKPSKGVGTFRLIGKTEYDDYLVQDLLQERAPYPVSRRDFEMNYDTLQDFDVEAFTKDRMTCSRREHSMLNQYSGKSNIDYWTQYPGENYDRCSFCGSCRFDLLLQAISGINEGKEGYYLEKATGKNYKYYLRIPELGSQIKFYTFHVPADLFTPAEKEKLDKINAALDSALKISYNNLMNRHFNG